VTTTHLLYLHGFRSSPLSTKARLIHRWVELRRPDLTWLCPQLPVSPAAALRETLAAIGSWPRTSMAVIGSSLGGFYATVLAEQLGCRCVLLNPAIEPARDLQKYIGEMTAWHSEERLFFRAEFVDELRAMHPKRITDPQRYLAVIAKGDEVLDWREMTGRYPGAKIKLLEGSDHALSDIDLHLADVFGFLDLA
jgi:predicted esterase YcpF (UPF0227 family)